MVREACYGYDEEGKDDHMLGMRVVLSYRGNCNSNSVSLLVRYLLISVSVLHLMGP